MSKPAIIAATSFGDYVYALDTAGRVLVRFRNYSTRVDKVDQTREQFDDYVAQMRQHIDQMETLARTTIVGPNYSQWGKVDGATKFGDGVVSVHTASHGGFILSEDRNALVHDEWRAANGQYEENECWAIVAVTFPDLFTDWELTVATRTLKNSMPHEFQKVTGTVVKIEESHQLQVEAARIRNAKSWVVISATSDRSVGMVRCTAAIGGNRGANDTREFLVPIDEYNYPVGGFVIDEQRHALAA